MGGIALARAQGHWENAMTIELDRRRVLQLLGVSAGSVSFMGHLSSAWAAGDTVTLGWPSDVPSWDPNQRFVPDAQPIFKLVFDSPLDQAPDLKLIPKLISKWELAPDALSMSIELRDDVTFHNGDKMTADDFRYTFFERIKAGHKLDIVNAWNKVMDIEVQSPTRAVLKFNSAAPTAPAWFAFLGSFVVPKKYMESVGVDGFVQKPIGSGPYKLVEYQLNSRIVLERNEAEDRAGDLPGRQGSLRARRGDSIRRGRSHYPGAGARGRATWPRAGARRRAQSDDPCDPDPVPQRPRLRRR
jgi:peptide/nickel transport system substrate-binding protein